MKSSSRPSTHARACCHMQGALWLCLALAVGSAANAGIIKISDNVSYTDNATVQWNVDGVGPDEFEFFDFHGAITGSSLMQTRGLIAPLNSLATTSDAGGDFLRPISPSDVVGAGNFYFDSLPEAIDDIGVSSPEPEVDFGPFTQFGFSAPGGSGVFGFRFDNAGTANYGIARFTFDSWDGSLPMGTFTITEWAYDDSGAAISGNAFAVSAPAPLALIGMVAGVAAVRRRQSTMGKNTNRAESVRTV